MQKRKPIIAIDISSSGKGGGPYTSTMNLVNSSLKEDYNYQIFEYNTQMGRFISFKRIKDIVSQLKKINPDIVHFTGLQLSGFHIAIACRIAKIKNTIVVIHGSSTEAMDIGLIKRLIIYLLESLTLAITTTFYGVSRYSSMLSVTRPFQKKSSGFVYNLPMLKKGNRNHFVKENFGLSHEDIVVVTVARITKDKGYHIYTQAIKEFQDTPSIKFLIVGSGDYLPIMKNELIIQEQLGQVKFLGYRDDVSEILSLSEIFVLPTLHETLSISLLEASFFKLPLIASNVGGVPEIITHGENGFLVPAADPIALAKCIRKLADDAVLRKNMGEKAKEKLGIRFDEKLIITRINEIYQNLLDRHK